MRVHSECLTSEVFGSLKCDCKEQLDAAHGRDRAARRGRGPVPAPRGPRHRPRPTRSAPTTLQSRGHDTVDANRLLGLPDDARKYDVARDMLAHLGVESVRLMTNNPDKVDALRGLGVQVAGRVPVVVPANPHSARYLEAKRLRMEHDPAGPSLRAASGGVLE